MSPPALVYLHGFASGPSGTKSTHCRVWAQARGISFHAPDLNLPSFEELTITAQVAAVQHLLGRLAEPPVLVGSSLGGLVAAAAVHRGSAARMLLLLAPAFGFGQRRMNGPEWAEYRARCEMEVFHHALGRTQCLGPALMGDLPHWCDDGTWKLPVPAVVLHGRHDQSVPLGESEAFVLRNPKAQLVVVDDDHGLLAPPTLAKLDAILASAFAPRNGTARAQPAGRPR